MMSHRSLGWWHKTLNNLIFADDFLKLLDLGLQCQVGPLQILDVLVLGLHGDNLPLISLILTLWRSLLLERLEAYRSRLQDRCAWVERLSAEIQLCAGGTSCSLSLSILQR